MKEEIEVVVCDFEGMFVVLWWVVKFLLSWVMGGEYVFGGNLLLVFFFNYIWVFVEFVDD